DRRRLPHAGRRAGRGGGGPLHPAAPSRCCAGGAVTGAVTGVGGRMRRARRTGRRGAPVPLTFVAVAVLVATPAFAQRPAPPGSPAWREQGATQGDHQHRPGDALARADSAYAAGDRTL